MEPFMDEIELYVCVKISIFISGILTSFLLL